jgi:hypothetical protein
VRIANHACLVGNSLQPSSYLAPPPPPPSPLRFPTGCHAAVVTKPRDLHRSSFPR